MMTKEEQQADYQARVKIASPLIDALLKKHNLNLGAQFNTVKWPYTLDPVAIYVDTKDYAKVEIIVPDKLEETPADGATKPDEGVPSPIQPEDLKDIKPE